MEYQKLDFKTLVFEVTRKCNLKCAHCLRGDAQDISMSTDIIDQVIPQINSVSSISLTGGEPMLAPEVIEHLTDSIIRNNIYVGRVGMICNGTILDERAIRSVKAFNQLGKYILDRLIAYKDKTLSHDEFLELYPEIDITPIIISVDDYHYNNADEAKKYYMKYADPWTKIYTDPEWLERNHKTKDDFAPLANIGNAKKNNIGYEEVEYISEKSVMQYRHVYNSSHKIETADNAIQCPIEITALGNICIEEEASYDIMDKFNMGSVNNIPIFKALQEWQWKEPLLCKEIHKLMTLKTLETHDQEYMDGKIYDACENVITAIMLKRDSLKRIHEMLPYLSYEDVVKASNADLNLNTKGRYNKIMASMFPEDYDVGYVYDEKREELICSQMKIKNALNMMKGLYE